MGIVKCPNGHFYNNSVFDQCPNCNADTVNFDGGDSMTVPVGFDNSIDFGDSTIPASVGTDAMFSNVGADGKPVDSAQTVAIYNKEEYKVGPVAGWLVCIEGPDKGKDFRIMVGRNLIGRSSSNKYQVNLSDMSISRSEAVASIAYDDRHHEFIFGAGSYGNLLPFVDGQPCMNQIPIGFFSRIEIGQSTLIFVPFCGEKFTWTTESPKE